MERILYLLIAVILLSSCAISSQQPRVQEADEQAKPADATPRVKSAPEIVIQGELLNEPPENPRFIIAKPAVTNSVEQSMTDSISRQLMRLGYVEAQSREDANVVVWYRYDSEQTGLRQVGEAGDVWGDQLETVAVTDPTTIAPVAFTVQIVSLKESHFPGKVIPIWQGEWSSSLPVMSLVEFASGTLVQVFEQYQSEETRNQIAAFRQARERKVKRAINAYMKMVMYRIQKHWQKPKNNVKGKTCKVKIVQSAVGEIKSHTLLACDKDRRFRRSIEKAIKASSPLPLPREHVFDRSELILIFQG